MSKIFKLFVDENIKTWKKFSTKLLFVIIVLALAGVLALSKFMEHINEKEEEMYTGGYNWREDYQQQVDYIKKQLDNPAIDEETKSAMRDEMERYEAQLKYDIVPYMNNWKNDLINTMFELKSTDPNDSNISILTNLIEKNDFEGFMEYKKNEEKKLLEIKAITQQEYDDAIVVLNLKKEYGIGKDNNEQYWRTATISQIEQSQKSIRTGIDSDTSKALTAEQKKEKENEIKMYTYRIEHDIPLLEYVSDNYRMIFEILASNFVIALVAVAAMVIAGGEISTETQNGTIKFWALTPNKRWKILTAKLLSVIFYIVILTLIMSVLTIISANLFFDEIGNVYLYVENGEVQTIENTLYIIELYFAKAIPVVIFALFAIMLSTITRNTAVAVSFSVATYAGNGIVMTIINQYIKKDWIRFVPFNNLNIADKIFSNAQNPMAMLSGSFATSTSLQFSLGVLAVCAILMLITMYDSFNNRDII